MENLMENEMETDVIVFIYLMLEEQNTMFGFGA